MKNTCKDSYKKYKNTYNNTSDIYLKLFTLFTLIGEILVIVII